MNGAPQTPTIARPLENVGSTSANSLRAGDGVELVSGLGEPRRGVQVVVGAERNDQDIRLVDAGVGGHAARFGVDRRDRLLEEPHARLHDLAVREANGIECRPPEHDVELRVAEHERVALVDQRDRDVVAERFRERARELETSEARSQNHDTLHRAILGTMVSEDERPEVSVRRLDATEVHAHLDGLAAVLVDCVAGGASVSYMAPFSHEQARAAFEAVAAEVEEGRRLVLAAFDDGRLVGTVQVILALPPNQPHRGEIAKLLVHRSARRRGIAQLLMEHAESEARAEGKTLLVLDTVTGDNAERLYARLGWTRVGVIPGYALYPDGRPCDTTVFWKAL